MLDLPAELPRWVVISPVSEHGSVRYLEVLYLMLVVSLKFIKGSEAYRKLSIAMLKFTVQVDKSLSVAL